MAISILLIGAGILLAAAAAIVVYFVFFRKTQKWKSISGGMLNFPSIGGGTGVSLEWCKNKCLTTDGCKGIQYGGDQGNPDKTTCILRSDTPTMANVDPNQIGWTCYTPA